MKKIENGITGNKLKFVGECYTNVTFMGKTLKLRIQFESKPRTCLVWMGLNHSTF